MTTAKFSITESIEFGWRTMMSNIGALLLWGFLPSFAFGILSIVINIATRDAAVGWQLAIMVPKLFIQMFISVGIYQVYLDITAGRAPGLESYTRNLGLLLPALGASIVY